LEGQRNLHRFRVDESEKLKKKNYFINKFNKTYIACSLSILTNETKNLKRFIYESKKLKKIVLFKYLTYPALSVDFSTGT
jgi:hypothetical protein